MLHIHHAETEERTDSKAFADACWAADPRLSPTWWHELLGHTVGKIALDCRETAGLARLSEDGCNLIVASAATWPEVCKVLAGRAVPAAYVTVVMTDNLIEFNDITPHFVVWKPAAQERAAERQRVLQGLELLVKNGAIEAYGVQLAAHLPPLHAWLADAAVAAEAVWGRRKRAGLRLVSGQMDLLDLSLMTAPVTQHKDEAVSTLELTSRLGLGVIIDAPVLPEAPAPRADALAALTEVAQVEYALNQLLGGWPQVEGQQVFSVLAHLAQGAAPWPTPSHWASWQTQVLPVLRATWAELVTAETAELVGAYLKALEQLEGYGRELAAAAASPLLDEVLEEMTGRMPLAWQAADETVRATGLLTSLPGVTALMVKAAFDVRKLQHLDTLADVKTVLGAAV